MDKMCKYHKLLKACILVIIQKPMEKSYWVLVDGNQCDANCLKKKKSHTSTTLWFIKGLVHFRMKIS